jgi:hypothetical protein
MQNFTKRVDETIDKLSVNCGLEKSSDLFSIELSSLLDDLQESYEHWDKNTPDRFIFDLLVRRAYTAVVDYWETILMIIAANVEEDKDYELRMDMLNLVEHFLTTKELHSTIVFYSEIVLKMILMPPIAWRVGKPNTRIRKAAIICIIRIVEESLIDPKKLYANFRSLLTTLKNSLEDDWANDLRFAAVVLMKHLVRYLADEFDHEDYNLIYVELLKRLDDS